MQIIEGSEDDVPGLVTINPRGAEARERAQWEQFKTEYTDRVGITGHFKPGNPPEKRSDNEKEYPKMLYIAIQSPLHSGQWKCMIEEPAYYNFQTEDQYLRAKDLVQHFNLACTRTVSNRAEEDAIKAQGYCETSAEAMEWRTGARREKFIETGHREHDDRNLGDLAKAEKQAFEAANPGHQQEIKEQRKVRKKPGRKPKVAQEAPPA